MPERPRHMLIFKLPDDFDELEREEQGHLLINYFAAAAQDKLPGLQRIVCNYEGNGDSWQDAQWVFYGEGDDGLDIEIDFDHETTNKLDTFVCDWVDEMDPGWENNDGGFGTVEFTLDPAAVVLDHNQRFTDSRGVGTWPLWET